MWLLWQQAEVIHHSICRSTSSTDTARCQEEQEERPQFGMRVVRCHTSAVHRQIHKTCLIWPGRIGCRCSNPRAKVNISPKWNSQKRSRVLLVTDGQTRVEVEMLLHLNIEITRPGVDKVKPKGWFKYSLQTDRNDDVLIEHGGLPHVISLAVHLKLVDK